MSFFRTRTVSFELELSLSNSNSKCRPSSYAFYKLLAAVERILGSLERADPWVLFRTRTVQNKLPSAAPRSRLPINSLRSSSGFYNVWKKGRPLGPLSNSNSLFRTRRIAPIGSFAADSNCPKQASKGRPSSYASYKLLTAVERDYRKSRKGRPLGPRSNSNCPKQASKGRPSSPFSQTV